MLCKPLLLLSCLLFLFHLHLKNPSFLAKLIQPLFFFLAFKLLLTNKLFSHFGLDTVRVKIILVDYLQCPMFSLFI